MEMKTAYPENFTQSSSDIENILQTQTWKHKRQSKQLQNQTISHKKSASQGITTNKEIKPMKLPSIKNKINPYLMTVNLIKNTINPPRHGTNFDQNLNHSSKLFRFAIPYKILKDSLKIDLVNRQKSVSVTTMKVPLFPRSPYGKHKPDPNITFQETPIDKIPAKIRRSFCT